MARRGDGIYLRGKCWWLDAWINGVRHQKRLGKNISRSIALELSRVHRAAILKGEAGIGRKRKDLSFADARKRFDVWVKAEKRPTTQRGYLQCLSRLARTFGDKHLSGITAWTLESYKRQRTEGMRLVDRPADISDAEWNRRCHQAAKGAPIRVNRELAVLKTLFNRCKEWGLYEGENPVCAIRFRKEPKVRLRWLEPDEESRLLEALPSVMLRTLVTVGIHCGLRIQAEALTLTWPCVDLKRKMLTVEAAYAKNGRTRMIPLNSTVWGVLNGLKATSKTDHIFTNEDGDPYGSVGSIFNRACKRAGLTGVTPHTLRHTFASRLVMAGVDLRTVQELGGWQTLAMVERYAHLSPAHKAQAVERIACVPSSEAEKPVLLAAR